jgi:uncharacterized protein DUF6879
MGLTRLYKDDSSSITGCPSVYEADGADLVVQGPEVDADTAGQLVSPLAGERAVRISRHTIATALHRLRHPDSHREIEPFGAEHYRLFEDFEFSAFRLELLQRYDDPGEAEAIRRFRAGEPIHPPEDAGWWAGLVGRARARGATVQRVHVVVEPPSDYLCFELAVYAASVACGEDVRILPVAAGEQAELGLPGHDYWLFDSRTLAVLRYDAAGRLVTVELVSDPAAVVRHNHWRDAALARSIPYDVYMRRAAGAGSQRGEDFGPDHISP